MDFNPNKPAQTKQFFWATYIPDRNPKFKMYSQRGHALSAFQYRDNAILYKWIDEEWKEIFRIEDRNPNKIENCENCGAEIPKSQWGTRYSYNKWYDTKTDHPRYLAICKECFYPPKK